MPDMSLSQPISAQPLIVVDNVTLRVGAELFFPQTSWTIQAGEHWAILGPTGSGKTILINALCRNIPVVQGRILYFFDRAHTPDVPPRSYLKRGEVIRISPETQKDLVTLHSGYHQARWQSIEGTDVPTVAEVLTGKHIEHVSPYEVSPLNVPEEVYQMRREHAVAVLEIEHLLSRKVFQLSHGEGRKVLLARALMQLPRLLILDDPFCGLDQHSRENLTRIFEQFLSQNQTHLIIVTPRSEEIPDGITHLLRVEHHQIVECGPKRTALPHEQQAEGISLTHLAPQAAAIRAQYAPKPAASLGDILIDMRQVAVAYGDVQVLRDITWTMRAGEHWAILGPNGAGKSTLLSLILADNPRAYANDIRLFGRRRGSGESIWEIKRQIGWVAPELHLYYPVNTPCLHVVCSGFFDSIGLYRAPTEEQVAHAQTCMQTLGIADLGQHPFGAMSVGQQRLALLARALVKTPRLLILDEPCQGLDVAHRTHLLHVLDHLCQTTAVNLLYVTHHRDEFPQAITHVLTLAQGGVQSISEIYNS